MPEDLGQAAHTADKITDAAASSAAPQGQAKKKSLKLPLLLSAVVVIGAGAGAAWYLGMLPLGTGRAGHGVATAADSQGGSHGDSQAGDSHGGNPPLGTILPFDPFIANLGDEGGRRYLKATFQVEFIGESVPPRAKERLPLMRDLILTLLTSKTFDEIRTPEGKQRLREEIIGRVNQTLDRDVAKAVYFTDFIVQ